MWCHGCRDDVAAEVSSTTGRARCARCNGDLGTVRRPVTEHARELLKQWSATVDRDRPEGVSLESLPDLASGEQAATVDRDRRHQPERPWAEAIDPATAAVGSVGDLGNGDKTQSPEVVSLPIVDHAQSAAVNRVDPPHPPATKPHFDANAAIASPARKSGSFAHVIGQMLAYAGILALTTGTALVIWSHFGDEPDFAPTGWLVASGGQMLLFLGLTTIVVGGLEHTNREIRTRLEDVTERLNRIERLAIQSSKPRVVHPGETHSGGQPEAVRKRA